MIQSIDYAAIAPPLIVALGAIAVLLTDLFVTDRRVLDAISLGALGAALASLLVLVAGDHPRGTFCVPSGLRGGGPASCSYVVDDFTLLLQGVLLLAALVVAALSAAELAGGRIPAGEYHLLLLSTVTGAVALAASRDLITLVVALEVTSLPVFAMAALRRADPRGSEAAVKLFLVSVISTALMLFGISLVYGVTGAVHLDRIALALAEVRDPLAAVGIVLVLAGFGFKIAAVPFHFWAPDVYPGAPVPVTAYLSVVSKTAGFAGLALVLGIGFAPYAASWGWVVAVLAALTMTLGNLVALRQRAVLRLLAWSSVAQSGYMLAPLGIAAAAPDRFGEAVGATLAYVTIYAAMNIGAFAVVAVVAARYPRGELDDYRGLGRSNPLLAGLLALFLICLAGLPPGLAGLFAKIVVIREVVAGSLGWLAVVIAVNTVIGLYYYLAWAARLFVTRSAEQGAPPRAGLGVALAAGGAAAVVLAVSVAPQLVLRLAELAGAAIG